MRVTALILLLALPCIATTIHVPADQPSIQGGIDAANAGDTVLVACGTYYEFDIVMKSGLYVASETGQSNCVTIDAAQPQLTRVFYCEGVDEYTSIVGFTITGGSANYNGGGMYCTSSDLSIINCKFVANAAIYNEAYDQTEGGGGLHLLNSSPRIVDCVFEGNQARYQGAGMFCNNSTPMLSGCLFTQNTTTDASGYGGAVHLSSSAATFIDCSFIDNAAGYSGGGMECRASDPMLENCIFIGNWANRGGGLYLYVSSPLLLDCGFIDNTVSFRGGGIHCYSHSSPSLTSCTFVSNHASQGGGVCCYHYASPHLQNCIVAYSSSGRAVYTADGSSAPSLECSDLFGNVGGDWVGFIADQYGSNGNISADPFFCDPDLGDFHLRSDSPCAPDNNDCGVLMGAWPVGCSTSTSNLTWSAIKTLY